MAKVTRTMISLELRMEEAEFLAALLGKCTSGNPGDEIYSELLAAGIDATFKQAIPNIDVWENEVVASLK